jgi:predicted membrane channel-forming protein YqfA (hemolysin III family)
VVDKEDSWSGVTSPILNYICTLLVLLLVLYLDFGAFKNFVPALLVSQYFMPLCLAIFTLYVNPQILLVLTEWEYNERKSVKEQSFLSKLNYSLVFNMIFGPYLITVLVFYIQHGQDPRFKPKVCLLDSLKMLNGFYTRFFI